MLRIKTASGACTRDSSNALFFMILPALLVTQGTPNLGSSMVMLAGALLVGLLYWGRGIIRVGHEFLAGWTLAWIGMTIAFSRGLAGFVFGNAAIRVSVLALIAIVAVAIAIRLRGKMPSAPIAPRAAKSTIILLTAWMGIEAASLVAFDSPMFHPGDLATTVAAIILVALTIDHEPERAHE